MTETPIQLLKRIRQWDQLPEFSEKFADGSYWMRCIDDVIAAQQSVQADFGSKGHVGDPCIYCGVAHNNVSVGDCPSR